MTKVGVPLVWAGLGVLVLMLTFSDLFRNIRTTDTTQATATRNVMLTISKISPRVDKSYEVEAGESRQSSAHRVGVSTIGGYSVGVSTIEFISHNIFDQVVSSIG